MLKLVYLTSNLNHSGRVECCLVESLSIHFQDVVDHVGANGRARPEVATEGYKVLMVFHR